MRLYVDLTCAFEDVGRIAHGTLRVERGLVGAFAMMNAPDISFVRYDRSQNRFQSVSRDVALAVVTAPTTPESRRGLRAAWRGHPVFAAGRRPEKWVRRIIRDPFRRFRNRRLAPLRHAVSQQAATAGSAGSGMDAAMIFEPDGILLLSGELRQPQVDIIAVRRAGTRLAFVFYDLLDVLAPGDPRTTDPVATDLPFTDFMVREADFILSISRYSANQLAAYAAERRRTLAAVAVIRLSGSLTPSVPRKAVAGLHPRQFVVCVGEITPRKNQGLLIDIWRQLRDENRQHLLPLVLVGRIEKDSTDRIRAIQADARLAEHVMVLPNLADEEVAWLYENCRFSAFPSLNEGFGLPVAESLGFGRVCIASTATSIPEAGQGLSVGIHPQDTKAWHATIAELLHDNAALERLEDQIRRTFLRLSWTDSAHDVLNAIGWSVEHPPAHGSPLPPAAS